MNSRIVKRLAAFGVLALVLPALASSPSLAQPGSRTFPETGKTVSGKFLQYWDGNGGLAQQGYPISEEMPEQSDTDGKTYTVQYFERAVFELHPENAGTKYEVLLSLLGNFYYQEKYPSGASDQKISTENAIKFSETGKSLGGIFRQYWEKNGGLAQQGFPISEEFQEKSDLNGLTYTVQYFERAVFEAHPENAPPYNVLLSQLGTFRYKAKYQTVTQPTPTPTTAPAAATPTVAAPTATLPPGPPLRDVEFLGKVADSSTPFEGPVGITTDAQDNLYVADTRSNRVLKFDSTGHLVLQFGSGGSDDGQFRFGDVGDVAVDSAGIIYVADALNQRVQKFDSNGQFLTKWGSSGTGNGQFGRTEGVAVDTQGNVYAVDDRFNTSLSGRIQKFDSNGGFLAEWHDMDNPGYIDTDAQGNVYMAAYVADFVRKYDSTGRLLASVATRPLSDPAGIAIDQQGDIFVSSGINPQSSRTTEYFVAKYNQSGQLLAKWGSLGPGDGQFRGGGDVAVDSQGNVYVSDSINKTVQKFRLK